MRYPRWLVVLMVGLSCGCFSMLNGGGADAFLGDLYRQRHGDAGAPNSHRPPYESADQFCLTAFVATSISGLLLRLPAFKDTSSVAMAASVLLLVPGFPLINAVADMFKGHVNTGLARWAMASLLTLATCIGVVMAMSLWDLRGWS